jgi:hypothetical protein
VRSLPNGLEKFAAPRRSGTPNRVRVHISSISVPSSPTVAEKFS